MRTTLHLSSNRSLLERTMVPHGEVPQCPRGSLIKALAKCLGIFFLLSLTSDPQIPSGILSLLQALTSKYSCRFLISPFPVTVAVDNIWEAIQGWAYTTGSIKQSPIVALPTRASSRSLSSGLEHSTQDPLHSLHYESRVRTRNICKQIILLSDVTSKVRGY